LSTHFQTAARQFVISFERDVRIGSERENDLCSFPRRPHQVLTKQLGSVHFCDDLAIEISSRAVAKILVRRTAETVSATVYAAAIAVDGVIEADVGTVVVRDDVARRCLFKDFELRLRWFTNPFD